MRTLKSFQLILALTLVVLVHTTQSKEEKLREKHVFQAEVSQMIELIINSLYTNKEIFMRELIFNASNALNKIRILALTNKEAPENLGELEIRIKPDDSKSALHIMDTGIGMTKSELINNLSTIAKSETSEFLKQNRENPDQVQLSDLIDQFGVGFYSSFLVADKVAVRSKSNKDPIEHVWESNSTGFSVRPADAEDRLDGSDGLNRGSVVTLFLKDEAKDFLKQDILKNLIKKYSQFINFPIYLWTSKTVTEEVPVEEKETADKKGETETNKEKLSNETEEERSNQKKTKKVDKIVYNWEKIQSSTSLESEISRFSLNDYLKTKENYLKFNRALIGPLERLINFDYFRYVKVNLYKPCTLWCDAARCNRPDCGVKVLSDSEKCPTAIYDEELSSTSTDLDSDQAYCNRPGYGFKVLSDSEKCPTAIYDKELSTVNTDLDSDQLDNLIKLFECNDKDDHNLHYVDLRLNPERYTGYKGHTARRVWKAIYEENCFVGKTRSPFEPDLCYEERLFYYAISGLHSSINIHLCAEYPCNPLLSSGCKDPFEPNLNEFMKRFHGHNEYLENLFTLFLMEIKALSISEPYFMKRVKWPDTSTEEAVTDLFKEVKKIDIPMFEEFSRMPKHISQELALHFHNITTTISDCVACDKCKLWGKVQLRGLGAAFKILSLKDVKKLNLNHQEIVAFINAIARLSNSILSLETFRDLLTTRDSTAYMTPFHNR